MNLSNALPRKGPERVIALSTLVNTFGNGLFTVVSVLYFNRILHFTAAQIGIAFTLAGVAQVLSAFPSGYIADRTSPVQLTSIGYVLLGTLSAFYFVASTYVAFVVLLCVIGFIDGVNRTSKQTLIARVVPSEEKVRLRAYLRAVTNLGIALGSVIGGIALTIDTREIYLTMIAFDILTYLVAAFIVLRLPHLPPHPEARDHSITLAIRDKPYVALSVLNAVMSIHYLILDIVLPLWVITHTSAPKVIVAIVFVINTVVVALFQVRASRGSEEPLPAAKAIRGAGFILAASCVIYASSGLTDSGLVAAALLALAGFVHVIGELRQAAGSWGIGFGLPPESAQGQYQAVWGLGFSLNGMLAPIVLTTLCIGLGIPGWLILGSILMVAGLLTVPLTIWALSHREIPQNENA